MQLTIKQLRAGTKYSQAEAAKKLGINPAQYNAIETLDKEMLYKIAKLYNVKPEDIKVVS